MKVFEYVFCTSYLVCPVIKIDFNFFLYFAVENKFTIGSTKLLVNVLKRI